MVLRQGIIFSKKTSQLHLSTFLQLGRRFFDVLPYAYLSNKDKLKEAKFISRLKIQAYFISQ